jgi:CRP-like cAMP-binding protein
MLKQIAESTRLREYMRGDILFWEGDPCDGLYIMEQGSAKIFRLSPQGRQYIVRVLQEEDTFGEVPAFDGGTNPVNVEALEACRVWVIDSEMLRGLVISHPKFYQVTHRLARLIDELPQDKSAPHWTQEQLAARLGTVREVVARSLKELERSGAIAIEDRRIQIVDRDIFRQWTQPNN